MGTRMALAMVAGGLILVVGCGSNRLIPHGADENADGPAARRVGSGFVIEGPLPNGNNQSVLVVLRQRIAGFRVASTADCPEITLRGRNSIHSSPNPTIYLNGTRTANTCVLDDIHMGDVARLEVYPNGIGPNPSYGADPNGLILVFTRHDEP